MIGLVIIGGLFVQSFIAQISRVAAAVFGFALTTGVLIWGLNVYGQSDATEEHFVTFFGIELSQSVFVLLSLAWYGYDGWQMVRAVRERQTTKDALARYPLLADEDAVRFYRGGFASWADRALGVAEPAPENVASLKVLDFVDRYPPSEGTALGRFFEKWDRSPEEFLVGLENRWFVLTNRRLIQRDGRDDRFKEVVLADVESYEIDGAKMTFRMRTGEEVTFENVGALPGRDLLSQYLAPQASQADAQGFDAVPDAG